MASRNNSKAKLAMEDGGDFTFRKPENRRWRLGCIVLGICCVALLIAVITIAATNTSNICNTPHCVKIGATLLENMNPTVAPCDNFYEFACGGWEKKNIIPEDRSRYSAFVVLRDQVQIVLKDLFERESESNEIEALVKVKKFYTSCKDLDTIEKRDAKPLTELLHKLGGWPVLNNSPGGRWNSSDFNLETLLGTLAGQYNNDILLSSWISVDDKNSSKYIMKIDQQDLGMPSRKYYLEPEFERYKAAYYQYMTTVAVMLGADEATASKDMLDLLEFETRLANLSIPEEERRDNEKLYNPTTIADLHKAIPEIDWYTYFSFNMPEEYKPVVYTEPLINRSPKYLSDMANLVVNQTPPRVTANYIIWRITINRVRNLSRRFRDAQQEYRSILFGTTTIPARWRACVDYVNEAMQFATGRMYVLQNFGGDSKKNTERMIVNLKKAFKDMLKTNDWMDKKTKKVAGEKCDKMDDQIGYPDWIMDDAKLNERYQELDISATGYFENVLDYINWSANRNWMKLRKDVDKKEWSFGPAVVNAFYSSSKNQIVFPAGILQPPFYHSDSPWYLNYGGIGMVIGHEITHGFDDRGRQYDKNGNLKQWWSDQSITTFKERAQCIVDQYDKYLMPENNKTLNGIQTQGENIADNGGLAQSLKAYKDNEDQSTFKLAGLTNYTSEQLFFLNFAQVWCSAFRPEGVDSAISTGVHSPGRYRIIGPLHNSVDFSRAFKCSPSSVMNPSSHDKCSVW